MERSEGSNPRHKAWLNVQKTAQTMVPEKPVKADGGKGLAVEDKCEVKWTLQ